VPTHGKATPFIRSGAIARATSRGRARRRTAPSPGTKAAEQQEFDLVLTDVLMPDMDGVEIVRAFSKRTPRPRLMVMTGGSSMLGMDFLSIAPALGADGVIAKPVRAKELLAAIATVLAVANKRAASPVAAAR
jgi:CheY-like chemotaxis protein